MKQQERDIHKHLLTLSFQDRNKKEVVCTASALSQLHKKIKDSYEFVYTHLLNYEAGEVLLDGYGKGSLQKTDSLKQ